MPFDPNTGAFIPEGPKFDPNTGAPLQPQASFASPVMAVATPTQVAPSPPVAQGMAPQPAREANGCCSGPTGCLGTTLVVLGVLNLGSLPVSIPAIITGAALMECCCADGNVRCLAKATYILAMVFMIIYLLYGILVYAILGDVYCAGIFEIDLDDYQDNKDAITDFCDACQDSDWACTAGWWYGWSVEETRAKCDTCDFCLYVLGALFIVGALTGELPIMICACLAVNKPKGMLPGEKAGVGV